jgi:hypothetical protein
MSKLVAAVGLAVMAASVAGQALALNPQPLPPRQIPVTSRHQLETHNRHGAIVHGFNYQVVSPRDAASGLPTGKRMHKPYTVTARVGH